MLKRPPLLLATGNAHKVGEIAAILKLHGAAFDLLCAGDFPHLPEPEENGATFAENALIKARAYHAATGLPTLADDSGLVVDALDGRPGLYSARYAPTQTARLDRVLGELVGIPAERRTARFVCVMACIDARGTEHLHEGRVEGRIAGGPRGEGGFGYDPIFELLTPEHAGMTMAELDAERKNRISHRALALEGLLPHLIGG